MPALLPREVLGTATLVVGDGGGVGVEGGEVAATTPPLQPPLWKGTTLLPELFLFIRGSLPIPCAHFIYYLDLK